MSLTVLEVEAVRQAPLSHTPYDYVLGSGVLKSDTIPDIRRDFPNIRKPGYLTVNEFDLRGRFKTLVEELASPENKGSPPQAAGYFRREPIGGSRVASGSPGLAS